MDIDELNFNKARSFLMGWSIFVFCLWFFGADLNNFKLFGNELVLTRNREYVWLLIGVAAFYLCLRCYQRLPDGALRFDSEMNEVYDCMLRIWPKVRLRFKDIKDIRDYKERIGAGQLTKVAAMRFRMNRLDLESRDKSVPAWKQKNDERALMMVEYYTHSKRTDGGTDEGWGFGRPIVVPIQISVFLKVVAFLIGMFTKSWFTDYVAPLVFGVAVTLIALHQWYVVAKLAAG